MRVIFGLFKSYVKSLVGLMGYEIISKHQSIGTLEQDLNISMIIVKNLGLQPKLIVDAGAHRGTWTATVQKIFRDATYILIEPQNLDISPELDSSKNNIQWVRCGLGPENAERVFFHNLRDDSSSFKLNNPARKKFEETLTMVRLDSLLKKLDLSIPDIAKLDCEGYDLEVLEGFGDLLGKIPFILIESSVSNPRFSNTTQKSIEFMESKNYAIINIAEAARLGPSLAMWNAELLFVNKKSAYYEIVLNPIL